MDAKIIRGNLLGVPISGNYVNINNADVGVLLGAAAGLAKTLFIAGAAVGIVSALLNAYANVETEEQTEQRKMKRKEEEERNEFVAWGTLVQVENWQPNGFIRKMNRKFCGTCLNETISMTCDSHSLIIPINQIRGYQRFKAKPYYPSFFSLNKHYLDHETEVRLFDGSVYRGKIEAPEKFDFLTPLGEQSILVNDFQTEHSIRSSIVRDVEQLKINITKFIGENHKKLEDYIGRENLEQFFRE